MSASPSRKQTDPWLSPTGPYPATHYSDEDIHGDAPACGAGEMWAASGTWGHVECAACLVVLFGVQMELAL